MTAQNLHLVARVVAKPEKTEELRALLHGLLEPTRKESGCIQYFLHQDRERPNEFVFIEEWTDAAALDAHLQTAHLQDAFARFEELLDGEPVLHRLTRID